MSKNLEDIEFVLQEVARFAKLSPEEFRKVSPRDCLSTLPHPTGQGIVIAGFAASSRIAKIALRAIEKSKYSGRLDVESVSDILGKIIVRRFLAEQRPLDQSQTDRAVESALRQAAKTIVDLTHLIPCHLIAEREPHSFSIGPVTFSRRENLWPRIQAQMRAYVEGPDGTEISGGRATPDKESRKLLSKEVDDYYGAFDWIAQVTIPKCDPAISRVQAEVKIQSALDCFQLLLGAYHSHRMQIGGIAAPGDRRSHLTLTPEGEVQISASISWRESGLGEGWWDTLVDKNAELIISLMGVALEHGTLLPAPAPLAHRFLDAVHWFGEAVRDQNIAARIIKYVTAIERILIATPQEDIAETIARRGAAFGRRGNEKLALLRKQIKRVYGLRSELTHGSRSPRDAKVSELVWLTEIFAQRILLGVLWHYGDLGLRSQNVTNSNIEEKYDEIVNLIETQAT